MSPGVNSTPLAQRQVYAQSTEPTTERDGVLWVDTGDPGRTTYVYSGETGGWEPVAPDPSEAIIAGELLW